jgi:hypothetical protein
MNSLWDDEQDKLVEACRRPDTPLWVDLVLLGIVLAVGSWLIYLILSMPS